MTMNVVFFILSSFTDKTFTDLAVRSKVGVLQEILQELLRYYTRKSNNISDYKEKIRKTRRDNKEWTIQRHRQHWEENVERKETQHRKLKRKDEQQLLKYLLCVV
jgi:predicted nucleic acid-binding protein